MNRCQNIVCTAEQFYQIHVFTADVYKAGTDANVYITIFGENGDTGERKLLKSETNSDKFERGKVRTSAATCIL